jgi:predicted nucleic acid-binding Zn ribbon protein
MTPETVPHSVPFFTRIAHVDGYSYEQADCGAHVDASQIAREETEPTCPQCRASLGLQDNRERADA